MNKPLTCIILNISQQLININNLFEEIRPLSKNVFVISLYKIDTAIDYELHNNIISIIHRCNRICDELEGDLLLISGEGFKKEVFTTLDSLLHIAERHGAVSPRGVNMGFLSVPITEYLSNSGADLDLVKCRECYDSISDKLPMYHIVPYGSSVCVLLKGALINKFGLFDDDATNIEDAVILWCLKVNQYGYSSIAANKVFIENTIPSQIESHSYPNKYPYALVQSADYINYFLPIYDRFASVLSNGYYSKPRVLLCMYQLTPTYNGTSEHTFGVAERFVKEFSDKYEIHILISKENAAFFNVHSKFKVIIDPNEITGVYHIGITFIQIDLTDILVLLNKHCLKILQTVLDVISFRCGYLAILTDSFIFKKAVEYSDGVITISEFTQRDLNLVFPDVTFKPNVKAIPIAASNIKHNNTGLHKNISLPFKEYILVFGNTFKHKSLANVCNVLPHINCNFIVVGHLLKGKFDNISSYESGHLSYDFITALYTNCKAMIFPSEYEGFGLPIVHGLQLGKKVIVSRTSINCEIEALYPQYANRLIYFDTFQDIKAIVENNVFDTVLMDIDDIRTYDDVAKETEKFLLEILNDPINDVRLRTRNELLTAVSYNSHSIRSIVKLFLYKKYPNILSKIRKVRSIIKRVFK